MSNICGFQRHTKIIIHKKFPLLCQYICAPRIGRDICAQNRFTIGRDLLCPAYIVLLRFHNTLRRCLTRKRFSVCREIPKGSNLSLEGERKEKKVEATSVDQSFCKDQKFLASKERTTCSSWCTVQYAAAQARVAREIKEISTQFSFL